MTYNFKTHKRGTTFNGVQFTLSINGVVKDLTGSVITMYIDNKTFSTTNGAILVTDAAGGKFQFKKQVVTLSPKTLPYYVTFVFPNGDNKIYLEGTWTILP
jgi:hypothetical protein